MKTGSDWCTLTGRLGRLSQAYGRSGSGLESWPEHDWNHLSATQAGVIVTGFNLKFSFSSCCDFHVIPGPGPRPPVA